MNKISLLPLFAALLGPVASQAAEINLFVDAAPNVYGSSAWPAWKANAYLTASNGTFVNMANSVNPANAGSTNVELEDMVVYSFGDLGRRLHFVYWIPNETIASLTAKNFQVGFDYVWDGVSYSDYYGPEWVTPTSWETYNGGVIGSGGFAWWGAYTTNTPAELAADLADWRPLMGDVTFRVRMDGAAASLTAYHGVPDGGATLALLGVGLLGLLVHRRRARR